MIQLGQWTIGVAFGAALMTFLLGAVAFLRKDRMFLESAVRGTITTSFFVTVASAGILYAFVAGDYGIEYVWGHSDRDMSIFYKIGAFWGGQEGSLLFWSLLLSFLSAAFVLNNRRGRVELMAPTISAIMFVQIFFLGVVMVLANPFERIPDFIPPDGRGLNPLLQHPAMVIHPPSLYLGFVGMTIPFALAIGALVSGRLDDEWIKKSRVWTLIAWIFLGAGNILGGRWAYVELGWGGYWAWDPVENAAFMPWLAGTAFLHSIMMQERKGMLKVWNMVLVIVTFLLTIFGTFITRSGLISSVHSFAQSPVGSHFAAFLIVVTVVSLGLVIYRLPRLKSDNRLDAIVSRESFFILNNLILLVAAFAVLWGTIFPVISEAVQGQRISVGPPFFNKIMTPLGLVLLFLTGAGPLIPWRRATLSSMLRIFRIPLLLTLVGGGILLLLHQDGWALAAQLLCIFVAVTILQEFWRGARARQRTVGDSIPRAILNLILRNRRRYGGYIVHAGVVLIFLGFSGNAFNKQGEGMLDPGQSMHLGSYSLTYLNMEQREDASMEQVGANLLLTEGDRELAVMFPQKNWYKKNEQLSSEVAIYSTLKEDLYVVLSGLDGQKVSVTAYLNPLVQLFWIGGIVMIAGGVIAALPQGRRRRGMSS